MLPAKNTSEGIEIGNCDGDGCGFARVEEHRVQVDVCRGEDFEKNRVVRVVRLAHDVVASDVPKEVVDPHGRVSVSQLIGDREVRRRNRGEEGARCDGACETEVEEGGVRKKIPRAVVDEKKGSQIVSILFEEMLPSAGIEVDLREHERCERDGDDDEADENDPAENEKLSPTSLVVRKILDEFEAALDVG